MDSVRRPFVLKAIAFFLAVTVFASLFPSGLPVRAENGSGIQVAFPFDEYNITSDGLTYNEASKDNAVDALYEEISLRTPNSKTLRMNDGMYRIGTYGFEIHFPTSEGYEEYDNTLKLSDGYYSPARSDAEIYFSESKPEYRISYGGTEVSFALLGDNLKEPVVEIGELPEEEYSTKAGRLFSVPKAKSKIDYIRYKRTVL